MSDIFISHSKHDATLATGLADRCKSAGLSVFVDQYAIQPGEDWLERIDEELESCEAVWLLASKKAIASGMVNQEIGAARAHKVELIPIVWDMPPEELPSELQRLQAVVLTNKTQGEVNEQLTNLIARATKKKKWQQATAIGVVGLAIIAFFFGSKAPIAS